MVVIIRYYAKLDCYTSVSVSGGGGGGGEGQLVIGTGERVVLKGNW